MKKRLKKKLNKQLQAQRQVSHEYQAVTKKTSPYHKRRQFKEKLQVNKYALEYARKAGLIADAELLLGSGNSIISQKLAEIKTKEKLIDERYGGHVPINLPVKLAWLRDFISYSEEVYKDTSKRTTYKSFNTITTKLWGTRPAEAHVLNFAYQNGFLDYPPQLLMAQIRLDIQDKFLEVLSHYEEQQIEGLFT